MMKAFYLLLLGFVLCATRSSGQIYLTPLDGSLVDCGQEKVVVVESTESRDNHFAVGWTIRPKGDQPTVDWSAYKREDPLALVDRYGVNSNPTAGPGDENDPGKSGYLLLNGVLDLKGKKFFPLATDDPWFPYKLHSGMRAVWSAERQGTRYGAIGNTAGSRTTESNVDAWLVELGSGSLHTVDLKPGATAAVEKFLEKRDPKDAARYQWSFSFDDVDEKTKGAQTGFKRNVLTLRFIAAVPDEPKDLDVGFVRFGVPQGNVTGVVPDEAGRRKFFQ